MPIKNIVTKLIKEDDSTYSLACSALGVYSNGKNLREVRKNFSVALELQLSVLREKALTTIRDAQYYRFANSDLSPFK